MDATVSSMVQKLRRERLHRLRPQVASGHVPDDCEALLRRCQSCGDLSIEVVEHPSARSFGSVSSFELEHLAERCAERLVCERCQRPSLLLLASSYCLFETSARLDLHLQARANSVSELFAVDTSGQIWPLELNQALSFRQLVVATPRPARCDSVRLDSLRQSSRRNVERLERVRRVLLEFERRRAPDPHIHGPTTLSARILESCVAGYAKLEPDEAPLVIIDSSRASPGQEGLLITSQRVHSSELSEPLPFAELENVEWRRGLIASAIYVNGLKALSVRGFKSENAGLVTHVLKKLSGAAASPSASATTKLGSPTRSSARRPRDSRRQIRGSRAPKGLDLDQSRLLGAVAALKVPGDLLHVYPIPEECLGYARRFAGDMEANETPLASVRSDLSSDSERLLLTNRSIFSTQSNDDNGLRLTSIHSAQLRQFGASTALEINGRNLLHQGLLPDLVLPQLTELLLAMCPLLPDPVGVEAEPETQGDLEATPSSHGSRMSRRMRSASPTSSGRTSASSVNWTPPPARAPLLPPPRQIHRRPDSGEPAPHSPLPPPVTELNARLDTTGRRTPPLTPLPPPFGPRSAAAPKPSAAAARASAVNLCEMDIDSLEFEHERAIEACRRIRLGHFQEGLKLLTLVTAHNPLDPEPLYGLAAALALCEQPQAALDTLQRALRLGFADGPRFEQDGAWLQLASHPEFERLRMRVERRARTDHPARLEQLRRGHTHMLLEGSEAMPNTRRVTRCPGCLEYRLVTPITNAARPWSLIESFHLQHVAPLAREQLPCESCGGFSVEVVGSIHVIEGPLQRPVHLIYWLDAGAMRNRFIFRRERDGSFRSIRTFTNTGSVSRQEASGANTALVERLGSPIPETAEAAIRDLGREHNQAAVSPLLRQLELLATRVDAQGRCAHPWLLREIIQSLVLIGANGAGAELVATANQLGSHREVDHAVAVDLTQAVLKLEGNPGLERLRSLLQHRSTASPPAARRALEFALAHVQRGATGPRSNKPTR